MKSHLQSYPCPLHLNSFWNLGFLLGVSIIIQIITGIFLGLHYTSDLNSAYFSLYFLIREIYIGWCLRYLHSTGSSFVFIFTTIGSPLTTVKHLGFPYLYYLYNSRPQRISFPSIKRSGINPRDVPGDIKLFFGH